MEINMRCIFCCGLGKTCRYCGYVKPKGKTREKNEYGCTCHKNQYCSTCRTPKITEEGIKNYEAFLEKTWQKLRKYQMESCGSFETDADILDLCGPWISGQPQITKILEAVELEQNPI